MDFETAETYEQTKLKLSAKSVSEDPFRPIVYKDEGSEVVARIVIEWYETEPTVEEYRSPTQAKMRWDSLSYLFTGGLTYNIRKIRLFRPVDGVMREVAE